MNTSKKKTLLGFLKEAKEDGLKTEVYFFENKDDKRPRWAVVDNCLLFEDKTNWAVWALTNPKHPKRKPLRIIRELRVDTLVGKEKKTLISMGDYIMPLPSMAGHHRTPQRLFDYLTRDMEEIEKHKPILKALHELYK